ALLRRDQAFAVAGGALPLGRRLHRHPLARGLRDLVTGAVLRHHPHRPRPRMLRAQRRPRRVVDFPGVRPSDCTQILHPRILPRFRPELRPPANQIRPICVICGQNCSGEPPMKSLPLAASYPTAEGDPEDGRWPVLLARALRAEGLPVADPRIIATTGWTTDELSAAMDAAEPLGTWGCVSLLIGVNDQYRGRSVEAFREGFHHLLERAI